MPDRPDFSRPHVPLSAIVLQSDADQVEQKGCGEDVDGGDVGDGEEGEFEEGP